MGGARSRQVIHRRQRGVDRLWRHEVVDGSLLIEIVSPTSTGMDRVQKPAEYAAVGVPFYWRVETEPTVEVIAHELVEGAYRETGRLSSGEGALSAPYDVVIDVTALSGSVSPPPIGALAYGCSVCDRPRIMMHRIGFRHHGAIVEGVRTTLDLPEDVHAVATAIARDAGTSLSEVVTRLLRAGLGTAGPVRVSISPRTGLKVGDFGRVMTSEDVRSLDDDQ